MRTREGRLAAAVLATALLVGCGSDAVVDAAAGSSGTAGASSQRPSPTAPDRGPTTPPAPSEQAATTPPADDADPTAPAGGPSRPPASGPSSPPSPSAPGRPAPSSSAPGPAVPGSPGWPIEAPPVHGARRLAVYPAVAPAGDPSLQQALAAVRRGWEGARIGELGCDAGAAEALGRDPSEHAVAVYFGTREQVDAFARLYGRPFLGPVQVTTYCLD